MKGTMFVLGAKDLEMDAIEKFLENNLFDYEYAINELGERVSPKDANNSILLFGWNFKERYNRVVFIECKIREEDANDFDGLEVIHIDHHFNGVNKSSFHQLSELVGIELTHEENIIGIADHRLEDAYEMYPIEIYNLRKKAFEVSEEVESACSNYIREAQELKNGLFYNLTLSPNNFVTDLLLLHKMAMVISVPSDKKEKSKYTLIGFKNKERYDEAIRFYKEELKSDDLVLMEHRLIAIAYK